METDFDRKFDEKFERDSVKELSGSRNYYSHAGDAKFRIKITEKEPSILSRYTPIGIVLITLAVLYSLTFMGLLDSLLIILSCGVLAVLYRKSLDKYTLGSLVGIMALTIIDAVLTVYQADYFLNNQFDKGDFLSIFVLIVDFLTWGVLFMLPDKEKDLAPKIKQLFRVIPGMGMVMCVWWALYAFKILETTEASSTMLMTASALETLVFIGVAVALGFMLKQPLPEPDSHPDEREE